MNNTDEDGFVNGDPSRFFSYRESAYVKTEKEKSEVEVDALLFLFYSEILIVVIVQNGKIIRI